MTASTTTTIRGVSIYSRQRKRNGDVFDIALSPEGIVIRRPGRTEQHMTWERIAQWELEEQPDCIVLTLRGGGSVTPLMVKGWNLADLETVMRDATEGTAGADAAADPPVPQTREERQRRKRSRRGSRRSAGPPAGKRPGDRGAACGGPSSPLSCSASSPPRWSSCCCRARASSTGAFSAPWLRTRRAPRRRDRPRSHRSGRPGSAPDGTRRRDGCHASPRAAGRTRTSRWGRPGSRAP